MKSQIRCKSCPKCDSKGSCTVDTYDGRNYSYCFEETFKYIEENNLWEEMIKKHRIKDFKKTCNNFTK